MLGQGGTILKTKTGIRARLGYDTDVRTFRQGFEISLINMLTALMEKVYSMQNQMCSFRRTMETIREIKQKCQKSKTEMKNAFNGFISQHN